MYVIKVEKFETYKLYTAPTVAKIYRLIKFSCDQLEIGVTKKEIGSHQNFRLKVDKLNDQNILEIQIKNILFTIVKAIEVPMLHDYMEHKQPKEKITRIKVIPKRKSII